MTLTTRLGSLVPVLAGPVLLAAALAGCGSATTDAGDAGAGGTTDPSGGAAAGACLEGAADCDDIPTGDGGVTSGPDGSVPLGEAVAAGIQGPFLVSAFLVSDDAGTRLCEVLATSFPPQCGGTAVALDPAEPPADLALTTEGAVSWSEEPVLLEGELVDGTFVLRDG